MKRLSLIALILLIASPVHADIIGKVVAVADGDTIIVLTPDVRQVRVRAACIDAPEKAQPFGEKARQAMASLTFGREVTIIDRGTDRYGRTIGEITFVEPKGAMSLLGWIARGPSDALLRSANRAMIELGMAWVYRVYCHDPDLLSLEEVARGAHTGLWADQAPVAPWVWRKERRRR